jgi:hypothetical protein
MAALMKLPTGEVDEERLRRRAAGFMVRERVENEEDCFMSMEETLFDLGARISLLCPHLASDATEQALDTINWAREELVVEEKWRPRDKAIAGTLIREYEDLHEKWLEQVAKAGARGNRKGDPHRSRSGRQVRLEKLEIRME